MFQFIERIGIEIFLTESLCNRYFIIVIIENFYKIINCDNQHYKVIDQRNVVRHLTTTAFPNLFDAGGKEFSNPELNGAKQEIKWQSSVVMYRHMHTSSRQSTRPHMYQSLSRSSQGMIVKLIAITVRLPRSWLKHRASSVAYKRYNGPFNWLRDR